MEGTLAYNGKCVKCNWNCLLFQDLKTIAVCYNLENSIGGRLYTYIHHTTYEKVKIKIFIHGSSLNYDVLHRASNIYSI